MFEVLLTYLAANWMLAGGVTLAVIALGIAAWVFKSAKIALVAIVLAIGGFMYQGAVTHGIELQLQKEMAMKVALLNGRIETLNKANSDHAARAVEDSKTISELEVKAYETPANNRPALDHDAARRVRSIR